MCNHCCFVRILVGIFQHEIQWEIISLSCRSLPLCICVLVSHLSSHLSLSLSLTVWPRSCSSIGLEVCNHPLTLLLSQSLPGQTDPGFGKYPPLNINLLSSLNAGRFSSPYAHQVLLSNGEWAWEAMPYEEYPLELAVCISLNHLQITLIQCLMNTHFSTVMCVYVRTDNWHWANPGLDMCTHSLNTHYILTKPDFWLSA